MQPVNQRKNLNLDLSHTKVWTLLTLPSVFSVLPWGINLTGNQMDAGLFLETYLIVNSPQTTPIRLFYWQRNNAMFSSPSAVNFLVLCCLINVCFNFMFYSRLCIEIIGGASKNRHLWLTSMFYFNKTFFPYALAYHTCFKIQMS